MSGSESVFEDIAQSAVADLRGFLDATPEDQPLKKALGAFKDTLNRKRLRFADHELLSEFLSGYLLWAESRYPIRFPEGSPERRFLLQLQKWLRIFRYSSLANLDMVMRAPTLQEFARYVAASTYAPSTVMSTFRRQAQSKYDLKGFPSWLVIASHAHDIFIVFDDDRMFQGNRSVREIERRYEVTTLHEIGHAKLHLPWLYEEMRKRNKEQVVSKPRHEMEAWFYAYSVLGWIAGMRARVARLLNSVDNVGLA